MKMVFILLLFFTLTSCGPGLKDGTTDIAKGYTLHMSGGYETSISYTTGKERYRYGKTIIDSKVEQFYVQGDWLFVSRRPRELYKVSDVLHSRLINICEYWLVNVKTHSINGPFDTAMIGTMKEWVALNKSADAQDLIERGLACPLASP